MPEKTPSSFDELGKLVSILLVIYVAVAIWHRVWYSKVRYSIEYTVPMAQVVMEREPRDCDFLHAPIGSKDCEYEAIVNTSTITDPPTDNGLTRTETSAMGELMVSFDDGKTWVPKRSLPTKTYVYVTWKKTSPD